MAQFTVYANPNNSTRAAYPYLLDIQSEITRAIATQLSAVLAAPVRLQPEALPTESTEAYDAFLLGNTLHRYDQFDPAMIRRAASAADQVGFDSVWVLDRLLDPVEPRSDYPGTDPSQSVSRTIYDRPAVAAPLP